jgi:hypothetical protein
MWSPSGARRSPGGSIASPTGRVAYEAELLDHLAPPALVTPRRIGLPSPLCHAYIARRDLSSLHPLYPTETPRGKPTEIEIWIEAFAAGRALYATPGTPGGKLADERTRSLM